MTQTKLRFSSFEEYFAAGDDLELEGRYELIDGELVKLPPESPENIFSAWYLRDLFAQIVPRKLLCAHQCEIQVAVLESKDPANRFPDFVILRPEHRDLMKKRLTVKADMPPPQLVAEVISPGSQNRDRDFNRKRAQYAERGIPEYWILDPQTRSITVLELRDRDYVTFGIFANHELIFSPTFPSLDFTAAQVFSEE
ncbi:Uma2 family endonuclease [Leptolyngbya boryana CZ1]|uniref:Uma2 family endonuclease n=1 Tax=Leptolyngbya boryana CZ1 TaxID=3060204 RepID=A0AA96WR36_LEPBY|nr:Uma2 family endonuclease [Leptolyngbya boryana]WNZ44325.1 Uma2 family endonuclease [Leptolyngbya boryana CZ1]